MDQRHPVVTACFPHVSVSSLERKYLKYSTIAVTVAFACLCCGCAQGLIGSLPAVENPDDASEIYLVRRHFRDISAYVSFDNNDVLAIRKGQYTRLSVPAGEHRIAARYPGFGGTEIPIRLAPKTKYYFEIVWGSDTFYIRPITEQRARQFMTPSFHFLQLDNASRSDGPH